MNKQNQYAGKFEENISKVLMALAKAPRESTGEAWTTGDQLREVTNLSSTEINDAIRILEEQGYVDSLGTYGVAPFEFNRVALNARGRLEFERRKSQEILNSTQVKENHKEWDLFICHASEDKEEIVRPLAEALIKAGLHVWYDEFTLTIGDRLRRSIDKGLEQSRYGLVILSPNFFVKSWSQTELDGLAARERNGKKVILPVWHNVDEEYIKKFSPTLADRLAVSTKKGIGFIVKEVLKVAKPSKTGHAQEAIGESTINRLEQVLNSLRGKEEEFINETVRKTEFSNLKQIFLNVLDGIALFDASQSGTDTSVFNFILSAILKRNIKEGAELFETLLNWFFQTVTPHCRLIILQMFAYLTRLRYLKEVISQTGKVSSFVAEFGSSNSYDVAAANTEILMNIQSLLSDADLAKVVDSALVNDQIYCSWKAKRYLIKILASCEGRIDKTKIEKLRKKLGE